MSGYEEFFSEHYDEVVRTLALATGDRGRAEDAAQEAFAKAFRKWSAVRSMDRPVGWVVVVGTRDLRRWITRHDRRFGAATDLLPDVSAAWATGLSSGSDPADAVVTTVSVRGALEWLPPRQRATVVLRHLAGLSTEETAKALGCSTVGSVVVQRVNGSFLWMQLLFPQGPVEVTIFEGHPAAYSMQTSEICSGSGTASPNGDTISTPDACETQVEAESVIWWPSAGVMVAVQAPTRAEALQVASSLSEVDAAGWATFTASATGERAEAPATSSAGTGIPSGSGSSSSVDQRTDEPATTLPPTGSPTSTDEDEQSSQSEEATRSSSEPGDGIVVVPSD